MIINGGKILAVRACGSAPGARIEVRQLFFNLPARRKFLRSEETESAHIQHYLTLAALAYPAVAFEFVKDGRVVWQLPAVKTEDRWRALRERLRALHGNDEKLLAVDFSAEFPAGWLTKLTPKPHRQRRPFRVWGFIGAPGVSRSTREDQHIFVNRRPVENRGINFALLEGYHTALMKGRYPVCCLFIEIDAAEVDVNIHPVQARGEVPSRKGRARDGLPKPCVRHCCDCIAPVAVRTAATQPRCGAAGGPALA